MKIYEDHLLQKENIRVSARNNQTRNSSIRSRNLFERLATCQYFLYYLLSILMFFLLLVVQVACPKNIQSTHMPLMQNRWQKQTIIFCRTLNFYRFSYRFSKATCLGYLIKKFPLTKLFPNFVPSYLLLWLDSPEAPCYAFDCNVR